MPLERFQRRGTATKLQHNRDHVDTDDLVNGSFHHKWWLLTTHCASISSTSNRYQLREMDTVGTSAAEQIRPVRTRRSAPRRAFLAASTVTCALLLSACWSSNQNKDLDFINWSRGTNGLPAVNGDAALMRKAQAWSEHMSRTGVLEHSGGGSNLNTSGIRNWCGVAENVAYNATTHAAHQSFMQSPPHRRNVLGNYDRVGTGVVRRGNTVWVTEIYVRSC